MYQAILITVFEGTNYKDVVKFSISRMSK